LVIYYGEHTLKYFFLGIFDKALRLPEEGKMLSEKHVPVKPREIVPSHTEEPGLMLRLFERVSQNSGE
jgi:hypothetical protein